MGKEKFIIAIDGHSSCGKSTVAKDLAKALSIAYVDTGAMYRSVTLYALRNNLIINGKVDEEKLIAALGNINVTFAFNASEKRNETFMNGESIEKEIRNMEVSSHVSLVSAIGAVRKQLVEWQRQMGKDTSLVMDGRDIGTVVFPNADLKIFMTASDEVRAQRRFDELTAKGEKVSMDEILNNVRERDRIDSTRAESPLRKADDALLLDNSNMTMGEQFEWIMERLRERNLI
ncbi:MAG: (d)CMP kinase [Bacteroidales bacterium]|nr:(d)CMP kinase [Bacteroidales bacterium]